MTASERDWLLSASTDELLERLAQTSTSSEAGRIAIRAIGKLIPAPPTRRLTLAELPADAPRVLRAVARSEPAATSGDLTLVLLGCGLPRDRSALARFSGEGASSPEELSVKFDARAWPLWKWIDAVVHDGLPLEHAAAALASADTGAVTLGMTALVWAHHVPVTRVQQPDAPIDPVRDDDDFGRNALAIAALAPDATIDALEADANTARDPRAASIVVLRRRGRAREPHLAAALTSRSRYAPLLADIVVALPASRREPLVLAAVPQPVAPHVEPTDLELRWLAATPSPRTAERLLEFARAWRRRRTGVPWEQLAAALRQMGEPGLSAADAVRDEMPPALRRALFGEARSARRK